MSEQNLITKTELKGRGWTDALIERFFPAPTKEILNLRHRSSAPIKLYDVAQVNSIEFTGEFKEAQSAPAERSRRAVAKAAQRREETRRWAEGLPAPEIPAYSRDDLRARARALRGVVARARGGEARLPRRAGRLPRPHLRQLPPPPAHALRGAAAQVARPRRRRRGARRHPPADPIAISETYPWLSEECTRQTSRAYGM